MVIFEAAAMEQELRNMVMTFRVTELQTLLNHFSRNKNGRKNELQARALELVKSRDPRVGEKTRELYRSIQLSLHQPLPASASMAHPQQQYSNPSTVIGRLYPPTTGISSQDKNYYHQNQNPYTSFNGGLQMPGFQSIGSNSLPICPDVRFRKLPFYDILSELTRPTTLRCTTARVQESSFQFVLTPKQANEIAESKELSTLSDAKCQYTVQVQLRFCAVDTSCPQDDLFPPSINVKVNQKLVQLPPTIPSNRPGVEAKRPSRPLNITNCVRVSPMAGNIINVTWALDPNPANAKDYVISLNIVKRLTSKELLKRLKDKRSRPPDYTKGMIKELVQKDDVDCIATTSFKVSVSCPLGKCRMSLPCRASTCKHLQCFDANLYLQMNEKKPVWSCPVCDKYTDFDDLAIDGYFEEVIAQLERENSDVTDVEVLPDGSWKPIQPKKETDEPQPKRMKKSHVTPNDTICLDDEDICVIPIDESEIRFTDTPPKLTHQTEPAKAKVVCDEIVDLTLSDDEDESFKPNHRQKAQETSEDSSEDEPFKVRYPRTRSSVKRAVIISESSSSDQDLSQTASNKNPNPVNSQIIERNQRSPSPECIILDSPSPSPPPCRTNNVNVSKNTSGKQQQRISTSSNIPQVKIPQLIESGEDPMLSSAQYSSFGSAGQTSTMNMFPATNSNPQSNDTSYSLNPYSASFERPSWETATFPSVSDYSSLEFPSMDYFNQVSSTSGSGYTGNRGSTNAFIQQQRW